MEKKLFETVEVEVVVLTNNDIIVTSSYDPAGILGKQGHKWFK